MGDLIRGTQVVFVPDHIGRADWANYGYPSGTQPGFIDTGPMSFDGEEAYFVRYWALDGRLVKRELRTKSNSELTNRRHLIVVVSVPGTWVQEALAKIDEGKR